MAWYDKKYLMWLLIIIPLVLMISGCGSSQEKATNTSTVTDTKVKPDKPAPPPKVLNLGLTLEQFKQAYKKNALEISGMNYNIDNAELNAGTGQDVFQCNLSEDVVIMGNVEKTTGLIKEVWVLCNPKTMDSAADALIAYGLIMTIVNPEMTTEQRGELMRELKLTDNRIQELSTKSSVANRGNVRYKTSMVSQGFFMFTASAKDL